MGKIKNRSQGRNKIQEEPSVIIDERLNKIKKVTFTSNKLEEVNKLVRNLKLPEFDSDGNPIL